MARRECLAIGWRIRLHDACSRKSMKIMSSFCGSYGTTGIRYASLTKAYSTCVSAASWRLRYGSRQLGWNPAGKATCR